MIAMLALLLVVAPFGSSVKAAFGVGTRLDTLGVAWIDLVDRFGVDRAMDETAGCVADAVSDWLSR